MPLFNRAVLINVTAALVLTFEYFFNHVSLLPLFISGILVFTVANVSLWLKAKSIKKKQDILT
jgi:hypothetical protein